MIQCDIEARIQDLMDGKLAPSERNALLAEISGNPELLDIYLDYAALESALTRISRSSASHQEEQNLVNESELRTRRKRRFLWPLAAAAAVMVLAAGTLNMISVRRHVPAVTYRLSPGSVFSVSHSMAEEEFAPGILMPGSRGKLEQGTVELNFASGVRSIVSGPADLTLHDGRKLILHSGNAWFDVPHSATGFMVQTQEMTVTDFGTIFGVSAQKGNRPEAHVFQGRVEVRTQGQDFAIVNLSAGMACAVGPLGHLKEIPAAPERFFQKLPDTLPYMHWSFDNAEELAAANGSLPAIEKGMGRMDGLENSKAFRTTQGRFGSALTCTADLAEAKCAWLGVGGDAPRTISHWLRLVPGGPEAQQIVGWGSHALSPNNANPAFLTYVRRIKVGTVAGVSFGAYCLNATTPIDDGRWHHFAAVYTGHELPDGRPELFCYLDGLPEPMSYGYRTDILSPQAPGALSVATALEVPGAIPVTLFPSHWCGDGRNSNMPLAIDELYIFEAALSETQVKNLYDKNSPR